MRSFDSKNNLNDSARFIEITSDDLVYVAGTNKGVDSQTDVLLIQYDAMGNFLWALEGAESKSQCRFTPPSFTTDRQSNSYMAGRYCRGKTNQDEDCAFALVKTSVDGERLWLYKTTYFPTNHSPSSLAIDDQGDIYSLFNTLNGDAGSCVLLKSDPDGNPLWQKRYPLVNDGSKVECVGLDVDTDGAVYVAGHVDAAGLFIDDDDFKLEESSWDFLLLKYENNGALSWETIVDDSGANQDDLASSVVIDQEGSVFLAGQNRYENGESHIALVKFSADGEILFQEIYNGDAGFKNVAGPIAVDSKGEITITGCSENRETMSDFITVKFNNDGALLWTRNFDGEKSLFDYPRSLAVDSQGNIHVAGVSCETYMDNTDADLYGCEQYLWQNVDSAGCSDGVYALVTLKYTPAGRTEWVETYYTDTKNDFVSLAVNEENPGFVFIAGQVEDDDKEDIITMAIDRDANNSAGGTDLCCGGCY